LRLTWLYDCGHTGLFVETFVSSPEKWRLKIMLLYKNDAKMRWNNLHLKIAQMK
jgi:hypothetical protein